MYPSDWKDPEYTLLGSGSKITFDQGLAMETVSLYDQSTGKYGPVEDALRSLESSKSSNNFKREDFTLSGYPAARV